MKIKRLFAEIKDAIPVLTHSLAALVPLLWWSASRQEFSITLTIGAIIVGNLPDIDSAYSHIGRRLYPAAKAIETRFGHRTITHSLFPVALIAGLSYIICSFTTELGPWWWWPTFYTSHLLLDMIIGGKTGVPLLWPLKTRFWLTDIEGGTTGERVIFLILLVAAVIPLTIHPAALDPTHILRQATGNVDMALYDYRQWEATNEVALQIQGTWQTDHRPITGTFPVDRVVGTTFHLIADDGTTFTAGQSGDIDVYLTRAVAIQGPPRRIAAGLPTPTPTPTATVTIRIPHVYDPAAEILVQPGDLITTGQLLADLQTYRLLIATSTPTPPPTAGPTPTPAGPDPLTISRAQADLALAEARYRAAIATPTPDPIAVATLAPQATAWAQFVSDRQNTLWRERHNPGGLAAWTARTELEQNAPQATAVAYRLDQALHPPGPDPLAISIARAQLEVARTRYRAAIATATPPPTYTPTPTTTSSSPAPADPTRIRALIAGRVLQVRIASVTGNEATVEITIEVKIH